MRRIGIFGGSFNPIHLGHLAVAQKVIADDWVDEVWLMVSPQNPLKQSATDLATETARLALAREAVRDYSHILVSDFELHLPKPSYTWRTMKALRERHSDCTFSLIIGADNWENFSRWARHEDLLEKHTLLVYPREDYVIDQSTLPPTVHLVDAPLFPQHSTNIRQRIKEGLTVEHLLPPSIIASATKLYS